MKPRILSTVRLSLPLASAIAALLAVPSLHAASGDWIADAGGNWGTVSNWAGPPVVAPGTTAGDVINFTNDITGNRAFTVNNVAPTAKTMGILNIGDANDTHTMTLSPSGTPPGTLLMDNSGSGAQINETGLRFYETINAAISLADNLAVNSAGALAISSVISESGTRSLTKTGDGILYLTSTAANTWTGGSTISAGGLSFRTTAAVPLTGTHAFGATTTLGLGVSTGGFTFAQVNDALNGTAPAVGTITFAGNTRIGIDTGAGATDFNVSLAASSRGLDKIGGNNLTLSADNSLYDGDIRIVLTRILVANANALGSTVGSTTVFGGGGTTASANTLDFSAATTDLSTAEKINFFGNAVGRARLALANDVALTHTLSGAIDVSSDTNIVEWNSGGATSLAAFKITGDITGTFSGGATGLLLRGATHGTSALTPINKIEGNVTLTNFGINKTDGGKWQLGASGETYKAPTLGVSNGLLLMGADNYLDTVTPVRLDMGAVSGGTTGSLDLNGFSQTVAGINLLGASGAKTITSSSGTPVLTVDNASDYTTGSLVALTGSLALTKTGGGTQTLGATNTYTGATTVNDGTLAITGSLSGSSAINIASGAFLTASSNNAFNNGSGNVPTGAWTIAGTLTQTANGSTMPASVTLNNGMISGAFKADFGTFLAAGSGATITANGATNTIDAGNLGLFAGLAVATPIVTDALAISSQLGGTSANGGGLTKTGLGTVTLSGTNTYNGNTTITGGTLALTGAATIANTPLIRINSSTTLDVTNLTAGTFAIGSAQTVVGGGTILATGKTVVASGTLSPGNSPGTLTQDGGSLQLGGVNGNLNWQVYDATGPAGIGGYDTVNLINGATLDLSLLSAVNPYDINLWSLSGISPSDVNGDAINFNNTSAYTWTLFSTGTAISGFDASYFDISTAAINGTSGFSNALGGGAFSVGLADGDTDLVLNFTPIPEPRAALLGGLGLLALLRRRR